MLKYFLPDMKRSRLNISLGSFLIFLIVAVVLGLGSFKKDQKSVLYSPLPEFLTKVKNNQVSTLNLFLPSANNQIFVPSKKPEISARSALVYDLSKKQMLFEKNINEKLPVASLTKIMTAIIALENKKNDDRYVVRKQSLVGENSMGVSEGEVLSLEELLYGLILPSGNDAAEVLASNFPGGRTRFIGSMNEKAKALGLVNTNFTNPSGLQGDGEQFSTAYDLLVFSNYALENFPLLKDVVATFRYSVPYTKTHKAFYLENETNLLTSYPGVKGVKTGYTPEAGFCLVTYLEYKGHKLIGIILGSNNRREEMKELLDYSLKSLGVTPPPHG